MILRLWRVGMLCLLAAYATSVSGAFEQAGGGASVVVVETTKGTFAFATFPSDAPQPADVARRLREAVGRFRALGAGLDPESRDRLWIRNPNAPRMRWHYSLPEAVRIQAVHVRHHAAQIAELTQS